MIVKGIIMNISQKSLISVAIIILSMATQSNAATFTVLNTADSGVGSLRQAILDANASAGLDTIAFAIPGVGPFTIAPITPLPVITSQVIIDGYTQSGSSVATATTPAVIMIELSGVNIDYISVAANRNTDYGLVLGSGSSGSTIRGLCINRFPGLPFSGVARLPGAGIRILSDSNIITGNFIGTPVNGLAYTGPAFTNAAGVTTTIFANASGIELNGANATGNTIGGITPALRNIIAGSLYYMGGVSLINGAQSNTVIGNYIGVDKNGTGVIGNTQFGVVFIGAVNNIVGGTTAAQRNIISGASMAQLSLMPLQNVLLLTSTDNSILGNYIGVNAAGTASLSNQTSALGILVQTSDGLTISNNLISGCAWGINAMAACFVQVFTEMPRKDYTISGNIIGLNALGTAPIPNGIGGVYLQGIEDSDILNNVISGNNGDGILIVQDVRRNNFKGNIIGLDPSGTIIFPNKGDGIRMGNFSVVNPLDNIFGGPNDADRNIIASNAGNGVEIKSGALNNTFTNNFIGTSITGDAVLRPNCADYGNHGNGVLIWAASHNLIEDNLITQNDLAGVAVRSSAGSLFAIDNAILSNSIFNNGGLGIDLEPNGVTGITPNDFQDPDLGPNRLQNFPCLRVRRCNDIIRVFGRLNSLPNSSFLIQFFDTKSLSKIPEGQTLLGETTVCTNSQGNACFSLSLPLDETCGLNITATATRLDDNCNPVETSEFGRGGLCVSAKNREKIAAQCGFDQGCTRPTAQV